MFGSIPGKRAIVRPKDGSSFIRIEVAPDRMRFTFEDTGLRVRDLDRAIAFFTETLGMRLEARVKANWTKGEFANLFTSDGKHKLELNWYAEDSPVAGPFREGDELDHLGFAVDDFDGALRRLADAGFKPALGPFHEG